MNANIREFLFAFISVHSRLESSWLRLVRVVENALMMDGMMGISMIIWTTIGVLLIVLLVVVIMKLLRKP